MRPKINEETWPYIDSLLQEVPEAIENLPSLKNSIQTVARKAAREAVAGMMPAVIHDAVQKGVVIGEQRGRQQTLLTVLQHKFGEIPPEVVRQVEQITNVDQFDRYLIQTLTATSLAELPWLNPNPTVTL